MSHRGSKSCSNIERDLQRSYNHRAWKELQELSDVDWNSVDSEEELEKTFEELSEIITDCDDQSLIDQLNEFLEEIQSLLP